MKAYSLIRPGPLYRHEAFLAGLKAAGWDARAARPAAPQPGELLVIWNRYGEFHELAGRFEARGGTVIVAENCYLGAGGSSPKFDIAGGVRPGHYFALAKHGHNGQGEWPDGDASRFERLGVELKPWYSGSERGGDYILVCPNRSFGIPGRMMRHDWGERTAERLRGERRPVRLRPHPLNSAPEIPLAEDLAGARAVVIWSSSAGVHALAEGIPVVCEAGHWILKSAACRTLAEVDAGALPERRPAFERMAWAQWTLEEIATGMPFRRLLG